jgi:hypothetical protein
MARRDIITIQGIKQPCLNLSGSVGLGGDNERGDVMLIQAYLIYVHPQTQDLLSSNDGLVELAGVSGMYDADTSRALSDYCRARSGGFLEVNGRVDPASYEGRNIKNPRGKLMVITRMHLDARANQPRWRSSDYVSDILRFYPQLNLHLHRSHSPLSNLVRGMKGVKLPKGLG